MFGMGAGELLVVLVVVLLVFGPGRLPEMMGNLGKAMREFQKGLREPPEIEKPSERRDCPEAGARSLTRLMGGLSGPPDVKAVAREQGHVRRALGPVHECWHLAITSGRR